ncbi:MATH and LRR domain-containing protein PFE0570w [Papilio machaon]|uniref:MATH and LRR domain-containing protein PFE0570w n=1 Tax=Papilio machaon TaxID=76193 RepID=UPI001E662DC9|nr:MATH and LRR domain-containing protein PFE0570w [Papilio machaon]
MAAWRGNFFISSRGAFLWSTTFIMLSGIVSCERQCYWCGPLAEQVHRSRRAPPCDLPTSHVTTCEPGLAYCAVVATSPPYVESRLCVKLYQDECYPLFCNSTKTWKMTCPCRDDLCNGNNTERENEAFAVLAKLVAKSQNVRIKKREISPNFNSSNRDRTIIITNITELNQTNEEINEIHEDDQMIVVTAISRPEQSKQDVSVDSSNPTSLKPKENLSTENGIENSSTENPTTSEYDQQESSENPAIKVTTQNVNKEIDNTNLGSTNSTSQKDDIEENVGDPGTTISYTETAAHKETESTTPITIMPTTTGIKENLTNNINMKSSEQLPTAEALQQNDSPSVTSTKTTEPIKMESTVSNTKEHETTTVEPTKGGGNFATRFSLNTYTLLAGMFVIVFL